MQVVFVSHLKGVCNTINAQPLSVKNFTVLFYFGAGGLVRTIIIEYCVFIDASGRGFTQGGGQGNSFVRFFFLFC